MYGYKVSKRLFHGEGLMFEFNFALHVGFILDEGQFEGFQKKILPLTISRKCVKQMNKFAFFFSENSFKQNK